MPANTQRSGKGRNLPGNKGALLSTGLVWAQPGFLGLGQRCLKVSGILRKWREHWDENRRKPELRFCSIWKAVQPQANFPFWAPICLSGPPSALQTLISPSAFLPLPPSVFPGPPICLSAPPPPSTFLGPGMPFWVLGCLSEKWACCLTDTEGLSLSEQGMK